MADTPSITSVLVKILLVLIAVSGVGFAMNAGISNYGTTTSIDFAGFQNTVYNFNTTVAKPLNNNLGAPLPPIQSFIQFLEVAILYIPNVITTLIQAPSVLENVVGAYQAALSDLGIPSWIFEGITITIGVWVLLKLARVGVRAVGDI